jgi:hypothetical protein
VNPTSLTPNRGMETITLSYQNRTVALAAPQRFWLAAHVEVLPAADPTKRLVAFMALYAREVLAGDLPGPYTDQRAVTFARLALVDPARYAAHRHGTDDELAAALQLPVAEIPAVRRDQPAGDGRSPPSWARRTTGCHQTRHAQRPPRRGGPS